MSERVGDRLQIVLERVLLVAFDDAAHSALRRAATAGSSARKRRD